MKKKMIPALIFIFIIYQSVVLGENEKIEFNRFKLSFPAPNSKDLDQGFLEINYNQGFPDLIIQTTLKKGWKGDLFVRTDQPFFSPINYQKPCQDLLWKLSSEPEKNFQPLDLSKQLIVSAISSTEIELDFRMILDWTDFPANYYISIIFSLETEDIPDRKKETKLKKNDSGSNPSLNE